MSKLQNIADISLPGERWVDLDCYILARDKYKLSNTGRIFNASMNRLVKLLTHSEGTNSFVFFHLRAYNKCFIHELVYKNFCLPIEDKPGYTQNIVHIDGIKANNMPGNLMVEYVKNINTSLFKDIEGYEGLYGVSKDGKVISYASNGKVSYSKISINATGYCYCQLWKNNKGKILKLHRLVATAFIDNPENKPHVNHKDCNKQNNNEWNLEWCTRSENMQHAADNGLINGKVILNTRTGETFLSYSRAAKTIGIHEETLSRNMRDKTRKSAHLYSHFIFRDKK